MKRLLLALILALPVLAAVSCGGSQDGVTGPIAPGGSLVRGVLLEKDPSPMAVDGGLVLWIGLSSGARQRTMLPSQFGAGGDPDVQRLYAIAERLVIGQRVVLRGTMVGDVLIVAEIRTLL